MSAGERQELQRLKNRLRSSLEEDQFWGLDVKKTKPKVKAEAKIEDKIESSRVQSSTSLFDAEPSAAPQKKLSTGEKVKELAKIAKEIAACKLCRLCETRNNTVPGEGNPDTKLVFVGEGPGANEDEQGRPFVGRAGKLLTDIIEKGMKIKREEVFILNIVKCRPPENREPAPDEILACMPYLRRQIDVINPEIIVPLGRPATSTLLETKSSMSSVRGQIHMKGGRKFIPTFHPAYLLRNPPEKKKTWEDIQVVMKQLGLPV